MSPRGVPRSAPRTTQTRPTTALHAVQRAPLAVAPTRASPLQHNTREARLAASLYRRSRRAARRDRSPPRNSDPHEVATPAHEKLQPLRRRAARRPERPPVGTVCTRVRICARGERRSSKTARRGRGAIGGWDRRGGSSYYRLGPVYWPARSVAERVPRSGPQRW